VSPAPTVCMSICWGGRRVSERETEDRSTSEEPPPLGSWARLYALVFANLAVLITFFYLLTKSFE
jgi:hypothetical protein